MIQFNLLPDVKLQYVRARRTKHFVTALSILVGGIAVSILLLLFVVVNVAQKKHLNDLSNDITKYSDQLKAVPDLDKILTIQNQLNSLPALEAKKVIGSRLVGYLTQLTPANATISSITVDFANNNIVMQGGADALSTVNKYADTLKFTTYATSDGTKKGNAFNGVVLSSFTRDSTTTVYELTFNYDPAIFDGASDVTLTVPKIITTRSETEKPSALFQTGGQ